MKITVTLLMLCVLFPLSTSAQGDAKLGLPEGAKARFGKDHITGNIAYSPDGTRLAMASSIEIWVYDVHTLTVKELTHTLWDANTDMRVGSQACLSVRTVRCQWEFAVVGCDTGHLRTMVQV